MMKQLSLTEYTFESYFLSGLATYDPDFPVTEWDQLIYATFLTIPLSHLLTFYLLIFVDVLPLCMSIYWIMGHI